MKILVISHNVFSNTENMGKTLCSYFENFNADDIAQFYIHSEVPTSNVCENYYRVTDKEMIKSIFGFKNGHIFGKSDIDLTKLTSRTDTGNEAKLYQRARKRTPLIYLLRNLWWKLGHYNNKMFKKWLNDFNPDCIFLVSGDYAFIYDIAYKIAKTRNIPLYVSCMDDYYINNKNKDKILGNLQYRLFMRSVNRVVKYSSALFCICDSMSKDYSRLFNKKCVTLHTSSSFDAPLSESKENKISYIGNLGYNRHLQLVDIGRELKKLDLSVNNIDVYSSEKREEILKYMTEDNGIIFHGSIDSNEVKKVMAKSLAVIHTESFDENIKKSVMYSVSTKIADSLMSGTCIFAYGPEEIASMKYLEDNDAAVYINSKDDLKSGLEELLNDEKRRNDTIDNAVNLAKKNHLPGTASCVIKKVLKANS